MNLNLYTPINNLGYGIVGTNIAKFLHKLDVDISLFQIGGINLTSPDDIPLFQQLIKNQDTFNYYSPCLKIWHENSLAEKIGCECAILEKHRTSAYNVKVKLNKKIDLKNKNIIIVDDMITTGNTIIETVKLLKTLGAKKFTAICVHGIFADNALERLKKNNIDVVSCNTIPNKVAKIDVSKLIADSLK